MKSIREQQDTIIREFALLEDPFDRYAYLIELSGLLPALPAEARRDDLAVRGCMSKVWLDIRVENGLFFFRGDSNTLILKGVLYLLEQVLCGQKAVDVAAAKLDFLMMAGILDTFESARRAGIGKILETLRQAAAQEK